MNAARPPNETPSFTYLPGSLNGMWHVLFWLLKDKIRSRRRKKGIKKTRKHRNIKKWNEPSGAGKFFHGDTQLFPCLRRWNVHKVIVLLP